MAISISCTIASIVKEIHNKQAVTQRTDKITLLLVWQAHK